MIAECSLPIAIVEPQNLRLETNKNGKSPYAKIKYVDTSLILDPFSIVTPRLPVLTYDYNRGRIDIDLASDDITLLKFKALQEKIIHNLHIQQYDWFQTHNLTLESVRERFQPFLQGTILSIYLSTVIKSGKPIVIYKQGIWSDSLKPATLANGKSVRLVLRLTGIQSFYSQGMIVPKNLKCHVVMHPVAILIS